MNGNGNGRLIWLKVAGLLIPLALGLIGYGSLKSDVQHTREEVSTKASRETVDAQYQAILRELQNVNARLDRIERRP